MSVYRVLDEKGRVFAWIPVSYDCAGGDDTCGSCVKCEMARYPALKVTVHETTTGFCPNCSEEIEIPIANGYRVTCSGCGSRSFTDIDGEDGVADISLIRDAFQPGEVVAWYRPSLDGVITGPHKRTVAKDQGSRIKFVDSGWLPLTGSQWAEPWQRRHDRELDKIRSRIEKRGKRGATA